MSISVLSRSSSNCSHISESLDSPKTPDIMDVCPSIFTRSSSKRLITLSNLTGILNVDENPASMTIDSMFTKSVVKKVVFDEPSLPSCMTRQDSIQAIVDDVDMIVPESPLSELARSESESSMYKEGDVRTNHEANNSTYECISRDEVPKHSEVNRHDDNDAAKDIDEHDGESLVGEALSDKPSTSHDAVDDDMPDCRPSSSGLISSNSTDIPAFGGIAPIQIAFSFDTTGSMSQCIDEVKGRLRDSIERLLSDIPNLEISILAHGDYCDEEHFYVTKSINFTNDIGALCDFVKDVEGTGGGDFEECYEHVLHIIRNELPWKPYAKKSIVMLGDAAPHASDYPLNVKKLDWKEEAMKLRNEMV